MCGLAGLVRLGTEGEAIDAESIVRSMCDLQAHRGPDDEGVTAVGRVCLGSRRLSIIDVSAAGHMPMSDESGRWWIVYNGEVYNFATIRDELASLGHSFRSRTDTEVVLHAYMEWGAGSLERFVGMFAFAVYDAESGEVALVRDRYGKKPIYYTRVGDMLLFSSEMKALMIGRRDLQVDKHEMLGWLLHRDAEALTPGTMIEGILSVLPGQIVTIGKNGITATKYYSPVAHVARPIYQRYAAAKPADIVDEIDRMLNDAVRLRLISDVPVGTMLSGGLDSSLVTAVAAQYSDDLSAFHVSIEGFPNLDERRFAEQLASAKRIPFIPFALTGAQFRQSLPYVTYLSDVPLTHPNSVAYHLISSVARQHGVIVLLSGEGADELFGGYSWNYRRRMMLSRLQPLLRMIPERLYQILALVVYDHVGMPVAGHHFRDLLPPTINLLDRYARVEWEERCAAAYEFVANENDRTVLGAMLADLNGFLSPLLRRLDRASMGASVECRVPFLDHRLVHQAINLPIDYKVGAYADKWILKQVASRYIPQGLVARKKVGFELPLAEYIRPLACTEFFANGYCESHIGLNRRGIERALASWQRWVHGMFGLIALEIWGRIFLMGQKVEQLVELIERCERRHVGYADAPLRSGTVAP